MIFNESIMRQLETSLRKLHIMKSPMTLTTVSIRDYPQKSKHLRLQIIKKWKNNKLSGFDYWDTWDLWPPGLTSGIGWLQIPLPPGHRAVDWTIQLRWPMEMNQVICIGDTIKDMGCYGDPSAGIDGERCVHQHYHITPHLG